MYIAHHKGWVETICGSMFSGKSEELIRRVRRAIYGKIESVVFKPAIDDRYEVDFVVSHNGTKIKAYAVKEANEILKFVSPNIQLVAIDEVQFFDEQVVEIVNKLANDGIRVIVAGLDTDFRGEPFGPMPKLMISSEYITKLTAICPICGAPANRTQRLIDGKPASYDEPIILVGAAESYEPRCRHHHEVPRKKQ